MSVQGVLFKECAQQLELPLTRLFRHIVQRCEFPERWKVGRITALHKCGAVSDPKMYRPVQVLVKLESIFENTIGPQLLKFLNKFILSSQFGFIKKSGKDTACCRL